MRLVSLAMLKPDMVLAKSIYYNDCLVLKEGSKDITRFTNSLHNMGIHYVYVEDLKSMDIKIPDVISEETRVSCKRILRQTLEDFANKTIIDISDLSESVTSILDELLLNSDVQISLNDISAADEYTFSHSVSTTVYALLIGKKLNYKRPMLERLAAGTLLHDLGKTFLDKKLINKSGILDPDEYETIKQHTTLGYEALKKCMNITELSKIISLYHHERMDGTGYPTGTPASELHEFVRIVAIADVYDALTTDRCYRKKWTANQAVNYLIEGADTKFDTNMVSAFIKQIAIYPNGSMVRLSNQMIGIVKEQNRNMPLRPIIRVISDSKGNDVEMYEIDLLKELSITIIESELELDN